MKRWDFKLALEVASYDQISACILSDIASFLQVSVTLTSLSDSKWQLCNRFFVTHFSLCDPKK
jgi:hypothetical protein